jgi:uncharacterized protein (TIGR03437 family)
LFEDLDATRASGGVYVLSEPGRFVVSWVAVPQYVDFGFGQPRTFQVRLYPDGRIEYAYSGVGSSAEAVVGIAPGGSRGGTSVVSYLESSTQGQEFSGAVAERFGTTQEIDTVAVAQKFYQNHEDAYEYLVIFNTLGIADSPSSIASERTVRTHWSGNGDDPVDMGAWFGSPARLESVINMGPLSQYPSNLTSPMEFRPTDTPLSVLAHEAGHLFLAFASIPDPSATWGRPMLGAQAAHWSFNFNSEASLLEGNRIRDDGPSATPRFWTTGASEGYSPLDQYLMGFRAAEDVPPFHTLFYVKGSPIPNTNAPATGYRFNGTRRDVTMSELIAAVGRRTPDYTIAPRHFRFAFLLVVPAGSQPSASDLAKLNNFRTSFATYYQTVSACTNCSFQTPQPSVDTGLRRELRMSSYPSVGLPGLVSVPVSVSVVTAPQSDLRIALTTQNGAAAAPASVVIPAGATSASFELTGVRTGVEELMAVPDDPAYETVYSRVQVAGSAAGLTLMLVSGDRQGASPGVPLAQPVVVQVVDLNNVPYPGVRVAASVNAGGSVTPASALTDATGSVGFQWTPGAGASNLLTATLEGSASSVTASTLSLPAFSRAGVVNAASFTPDLAAGSFASIFGDNLWAGASADAQSLPWPVTLGGVQVLLNGQPAQLTAVRQGQINFLIPDTFTPGAATLVVVNDVGSSAPVDVPVVALAPAIFGDSTGFGAIQVVGSGQWTNVNPARPDDYVEIYATGLGAVHTGEGNLLWTDQPVTVLFDGQPLADVPYQGLVPGYAGLYQINARIPANTAPGVHTLVLESGATRSNSVNVETR